MKFIDLLRLVLGNLSRRKARVALTAIGVVIGTAAVVILVSLAIGLQRNANEQLYGIGDLTQIQVSPSYGEGPGMPGGGGGGGGSLPQQQALLTNFALEELRAIPGVEVVIPREYLMTGGMLKYQKLESWANIIGVSVTDLSELGLEATEGTTYLGRGAIVVGAMVGAWVLSALPVHMGSGLPPAHVTVAPRLNAITAPPCWMLPNPS